MRLDKTVFWLSGQFHGALSKKSIEDSLDEAVYFENQAG